MANSARLPEVQLDAICDDHAPAGRFVEALARLLISMSEAERHSKDEPRRVEQQGGRQ